MRQTTLYDAGAAPLHVAIIMDGNGRWAADRGLPRVAGHHEGADTVRGVVEAAPGLGVGILTLYAFSSDNWQRPRGEVTTLMRLFQDYLCSERDRCVERGIRVSVIGRRDRLSAPLGAAVEAAEAATARGSTLHLRIAMDYSGRDAILQAARRVSAAAEISQESFSRLLGAVEHGGKIAPDVDLLIRTGGEQRLSDFLLWESAYAELFFTRKMWPDFGASDLAAVITEFHRRERRFGRIVEAAAS